MKKRVISATIALLISIPLILLGGIYFKLFMFVLALIGLWELMRVKDDIPKYMKIISYFILLVLLFKFQMFNFIVYFDIKMIAFTLLLLLLPLHVYNDNKKYNIEMCFYLLSSIIFLTVAFSFLVFIRDFNLMTFIYICIIAISTDTFAFFGGMFFGKHKLTHSFSPNKSVEGVIFGTIFGTLISSLFYFVYVNCKVEVLPLFLITVFLSALGQYGDLTFSSIKRHFEIKDFSNIMPGHGGVLDRLDSVIFIVIGYMLIFNFL